MNENNRNMVRVILIALICAAVMVVAGCASMTQDYWEDFYGVDLDKIHEEQKTEPRPGGVSEYEWGVYPYPFVLCGAYFCDAVY